MQILPDTNTIFWGLVFNEEESVSVVLAHFLCEMICRWQHMMNVTSYFTNEEMFRNSSLNTTICCVGYNTFKFSSLTKGLTLVPSESIMFSEDRGSMWLKHDWPHDAIFALWWRCLYFKAQREKDVLEQRENHVFQRGGDRPTVFLYRLDVSSDSTSDKKGNLLTVFKFPLYNTGNDTLNTQYVG